MEMVGQYQRKSTQDTHAILMMASTHCVQYNAPSFESTNLRFGCGQFEGTREKKGGMRGGLVKRFDSAIDGCRGYRPFNERQRNFFLNFEAYVYMMKWLSPGARRWQDLAKVGYLCPYGTIVAQRCRTIPRYNILRRSYSTPAPQGALSGIRILDLSRVLAVRVHSNNLTSTRI